MVVPNREFANINSFTTSLAISNLINSNSISKNIQIGAPRGRSTITSMNSLRVLSVLSKASSVQYVAHIEAQNLDPN